MKTKTQFTNRILSIVLALVMVAGMLPTISFTASAAEYDGVIGELYYKVDQENNVTTIFGNGALSSVSSLANVMTSNVVIEEGVTSISNYAFRGLVSLEKLTVNGDVTIGNYAFQGCASLSNINYYGTTEPSYTNDLSYITLYSSNGVPFCGLTPSNPTAKEGPCSGDHTGWTELSSLTETVPGCYEIKSGGKYYLSDDVRNSTNYRPTIRITCTEEVTLCLNGKTVYHAQSPSAQVISLSDGSTLNLCDCVGTGCIVGEKEILFAYSGATINMYSGTLKDSVKEAVYLLDDASFNMYGGTITGCNTRDEDAAIISYSSAQINIYGGNISGNHKYGISSEGSIYIAGDAKITGNVEGDVYLHEGQIITVGTLTSGADIGVTSAVSGDDIAITGSNTADYSQYFHADNSSYSITNKENKIYLHKHSCAHSATENTITQRCSVCNKHTATATLTADDAVYTGAAITDTATVSYSGDAWSGDEPVLSFENNVNVGTATAKMTAGGATASTTFKINPANISYTTVTFEENGGEEINPITVTFGEKYGSLPSSAITGLSGGNKNWYLVDADGNVTETNIKNLTIVSTARDHKLFIKRNVLVPSVSIALTVPGGISDGYQYYIPGASTRVLTATIGNMNTDVLDYTYLWYKDGTLIEGAASNVLTLDGNVSDSGTYKVEVTAKLKDGTNIVVGSDTATASKEQKVKILHAANTLRYDANGGEGSPQSSYTGGTILNVSKDLPTREFYDFTGWNTVPDGTGDSYKAEDAYTFANDNGNGGCEVTLYAQWKLVEYTVTYMADGESVSTETVGHGKDATLPAIPEKDGCIGKWDSDGKNITGDTTITAVYTAIPVVKPDEVKPEDKAELEDTKKQLEDMLDDDSYTDDDKKDIQDAIDDIDDALEVIGNVEEVEETISKLPAVDTVKPDDKEAIKAITDAQTAYNALSDYEKSLVDEAAKANLDKLVAALMVYDIVEGDGSSWTEDSNHNITFVVNGLFSKFVGIKVDGKDVDKANYEAKAGSTIITLKASYLDTLAVGEHTITVIYTDGETDGTFKVHAKANSPATGDNSHMMLWVALLFISGGAVITLTVVDRRRRMASNR